MENNFEVLQAAQLKMEQLLNELRALAELPIAEDDEYHIHVADGMTAIEEAIARLDDHILPH